MRTVTDYTFGVIPMFLLMGAFVSNSGMSRELFRAANTFVGHLRGGLGHRHRRGLRRLSPRSAGRRSRPPPPFQPSPIPRCAATAIRSPLPPASSRRAARLGAMLPPSTVLAVYGIITEQDIGKLFIAGILPGLLAIAMYVITIACIGAVRPDFLPAGKPQSVEGAVERAARHLGAADAVCLRHRRPLWRLVHPDRGGRRGRWRRLRDRSAARHGSTAPTSAARCCRRRAQRPRSSPC